MTVLPFSAQGQPAKAAWVIECSCTTTLPTLRSAICKLHFLALYSFKMAKWKARPSKKMSSSVSQIGRWLNLLPLNSLQEIRWLCFALVLDSGLSMQLRMKVVPSPGEGVFPGQSNRQRLGGNDRVVPSQSARERSTRILSG